jgi:hypothetical protein
VLQTAQARLARDIDPAFVAAGARPDLEGYLAEPALALVRREAPCRDPVLVGGEKMVRLRRRRTDRVPMPPRPELVGERVRVADAVLVSELSLAGVHGGIELVASELSPHHRLRLGDRRVADEQEVAVPRIKMPGRDADE